MFCIFRDFLKRFRYILNYIIIYGSLKQGLARDVSASNLRENLNISLGSTPEQWWQRGHELLSIENYLLATLCFRNSGDGFLEAKARSLDLRQQALGEKRMEVLFLSI